mmetsp:Transcript_22654/g.65952  ORF Transcript_22654/g.65952 Transcript_22654/m.65952 type:complete len:369 (+) Transcript_22654:243-1349(+)
MPRELEVLLAKALVVPDSEPEPVELDEPGPNPLALHEFLRAWLAGYHMGDPGVDDRGQLGAECHHPFSFQGAARVGHRALVHAGEQHPAACQDASPLVLQHVGHTDCGTATAGVKAAVVLGVDLEQRLERELELRALHPLGRVLEKLVGPDRQQMRKCFRLPDILPVVYNEGHPCTTGENPVQRFQLLGEQVRGVLPRYAAATEVRPRRVQDTRHLVGVRALPMSVDSELERFAGLLEEGQDEGTKSDPVLHPVDTNFMDPVRSADLLLHLVQQPRAAPSVPGHNESLEVRRERAGAFQQRVVNVQDEGQLPRLPEPPRIGSPQFLGLRVAHMQVQAALHHDPLQPWPTGRSPRRRLGQDRRRRPWHR